MPKKGYEQTKEHRRKIGKAKEGYKQTEEHIKKRIRKGKEHHSWRGGQTKSNGYVVIWKPNHLKAYSPNCYVKRSTLVAEKCFGRLLTKKELIHHINEIKDDDRPENLYLFPSKSKHIAYHNLENKPKLKTNLL